MRHGGFRDWVNFYFGSFEFASLMAGSIAPGEAISNTQNLHFSIDRPMLLYRTIALFSMPDVAVSSGSEQKPC